MNEYKKSYGGLVLLFVIYIAALTVAVFLPFNTKGMTLITMNISCIWFVLLTYVIYKTERIYWYTGVMYEEARDVPSEKRKEFAKKHFERFSAYAVLYLVYSVVSFFMKLSVGMDVTFMCVGVIAVAISTINIKLE